MPGLRGRRDVSGWEVVEVEAVGRERKVWLQEPGAPTTSRERRWLFKPVIVPETGRRQGEDRVETIVAELAGLLGVPCADVELAVRDGVEGSISRNVAPDGWNLALGSVLMTRNDPDYQEGRLNVRGRPGHSVPAIAAALDGCGPPPGTPGRSALEVFAGYLVLDAWVANQDRHDQNWAVLRRADATGELVLAASYDHASSLGFSLDDEQRQRRIADRSIAAWVERGRAQRFEHDPAAPRHAIPTLVDLAHRALDLTGPATRERWLGGLRDLDPAATEDAVRRTPELSDVSASFILILLSVNRGRLLDEH